MYTVMLLISGVFSAGEGAAPGSHMLRVAKALELARGDIPAMAGVADAAAARLAEGGNFYAGGQASLVSELCGRAGGFMQLKSLGETVPTAADVVLFTPEAGAEVPSALVDTGALIVVFGGASEGDNVHAFPNHAAEADISPTLANAIPGWLFTGELIAALTRLGRMPVLFESIGLYGGYPRIQRFQQAGVFYHDTHDVPAIAAGTIANGYVDAITAMLRRVEAEERANIERAAEWAADARRADKRLIMYSMGHLFPDEVEKTAIGDLFESAVWNSGFFALKVPDHSYAPGDVLIHIGYQHPPYRMLQRARPAGARVVYVDLLRHRDYAHDPDVIWIDPMWPWTDACVPIDNYDVPALAASGVVNGAIAWEIHRLTVENLAR